LAGVILDRSAVAIGFLAAAIAVGGFIAHAQEALRSGSEADVQKATIVGGLWGFATGLVLIGIDAIGG
jgi:hypothetical protein